MKGIAIYVAGFATGWAARMTLDSFREGAVGLVAAGYRVAERARRHIGVEREYVEDLLAEGRARYDAEREALVAAAKEDTSADEVLTEEETRGEPRVRAA